MLAFFTTEGSGAGDRLLGDLATALHLEGWRLGGAVQVNVARPEGARDDMELRLLSGRAVIRISQNLGSGSGGCRLDADGLERAVGLAEASLAGPVDLVIVNKFGKQEAEGRGFRPLIGQALAADIPVLTAVSVLKREAFLAFSGDLAQELPPDPAKIEAWCRTAAGPGMARVG